MLVWLTLPFYDFRGFRSVAVNSVYKLHFTFIFAVLLPVLSRLLLMSINTTFLDFFKMAAVRHRGFIKVRNFNCWSGWEASMRHHLIMPNVMPIGQTVVEISQFLDFSG